MAFENSESIMVERKRLVKVGQFECTARLEVLEEKPVKKVLTVNALSKILGKEKTGDDISFSGRTTYQIVYLTSEDKLASTMAEVQWQEKLEGVKEDNVYIAVKVKENTVSGFSSTEIAVSSLINVEAYGICSNKIQGALNLPDSYVKLDKNYEYQRVVNFVTDSFNEVGEGEVSAVASEVLSCFADVNVNNVLAGIDTVTVDGNVDITVYYLVNDKVVKENKVIDFKREIAALSTVPNNLCEASVNLDSLKVTASVSETDQKTNLVYSVELSVMAAVYAKDFAVLTEDCFSTEKETNNTYECVATTIYGNTSVYKDVVTLSAEAIEDAEDVLMVTPTNVTITDKAEQEDGTMLSGAINLEITYAGANGDVGSKTTLVPFAMNVLEARASCEFSLSAKLLSTKLKATKELELTVELRAVYVSSEEEYISYLTSVEELGDKEKSNAAIRVYVTSEGEDLFRVAKAISVRPEEIVKQNPSVNESLEAGTRLVIYSPLNIEF